MKKLWMRVGCSVSLTDDELRQILADYNAGAMSQIVRDAFASLRYELSGDTYVPSSSIEDFNRYYGTNYEPSEPECRL